MLEAKAKGRRIAVLADMKELGPDSAKFHYEVGKLDESHPVDVLFTYELALQIEKGAKRAGMEGRIPAFDENQKEAMVDALSKASDG